MDKELTEPKWVLIVWPQNISAQAQKFEIFEKKSSLWMSVVRGLVRELIKQYVKITYFTNC